MGRIIVAEENVRKQVDALCGSHKWQIGLIIGQLTADRDFVVHLARSPDTMEDEAEIESCDDGSEAVPKQEEKARKKSLKFSMSEEINEKWITEHARQVNRMLPGGLYITGVYIFSSPEFFNMNQSKLRQCLRHVQKLTDWNTFIKDAMAHNDRVLLHVCAATRKLTCRTMDIFDKNLTLKPAEFKYQSFLSKWNSVKCHFNADVRFHIPVSSEKSRLEIQILHGLQNQLEVIWKSTATINGKVVNDDEPLMEQTRTAKNKGNKESAVTHCVDFYTSKSNDEVKRMNKVSSVGLIKFIGTCYCHAFVHSKSSKGDAVRALKIDIIRSILSRLQLLCEEAEVNNLYQVDNWSLVSPMRVFLPFQESQIEFCDYVFKDEHLEDSLQRFSELLGINSMTDCLIFHEKCPDNETAAHLTTETESIEHAGTSDDDTNSETTGKFDFFMCSIGILMAIIAALVSLLYMR